jgi:hypothetical protein
MKRASLVMAAGGLLAAGISADRATAQDALWLMAPTNECAALESLVVYGFIDGGEGGDTTAFTALVNQGDPAICLEELRAYGFGAGFDNADCVTAWEILRRNGLPEYMSDQLGTFIGTILQPASAQDCADMLFELSAGQ